MTETRDSSRQWRRDCSLILADAGGQGLDLADLRVTFQVVKGELQTPNTATLRVYNPAPDTVARARKEFTKVLLLAGYGTNLGLIFSGSVIQYRAGRENGTDSRLEIWASDGDEAYNYSVVNTTLAAGAGPKEGLRVCLAAFSEQGAAAGHEPDLSGPALPRGKVLYGPAQKHLRQVTRDAGCSWSIQDGQVRIVDDTGYLPGEAVELTSATGLVGAPEQTNDGIRLRCLLNPRLRIGGLVRLDNRAVREARQDIFMGDAALAGLDRDGLYRVLKYSISGDTRGGRLAHGPALRGAGRYYAYAPGYGITSPAPAGDWREKS